MFELIKANSTHFTEQIRNESKHLDEVQIAGEIKSIVLPITDDPGDLSSHYVLEIDDTVGTIFVYVSRLMKGHYPFLETSNIVSLKGYVNVLHRNVKQSVEKSYSLVAYEAKELRLEDPASA